MNEVIQHQYHNGFDKKNVKDIKLLTTDDATREDCEVRV